MIQLLKITVSGFMMLEDNFTLNFVPEAKVVMDDGDNSNEINEIDDKLYVHKLVAITGRNASGKTTTLKLIKRVITLMKTGRWKSNPNDFNSDKISIKINFYKDGVIYIYQADIKRNASQDNILIGSAFCTIENEKLLYAKYKRNVGRRYEKELNFLKDDSMSTGLNDTGKIVFLCSDLYAYNMLYYSSSGTIVDDLFFENLNAFDFDLTCSIIKLLDESIEYIKYKKNNNVVAFKRFKEDEIIISKQGLLHILSNGTIKGIELYINTIKVLKTGGILLIDEIENCFHKNLVNNIFFLMEDRKINKKNAMIIFTTHYVEILDALNRRDSILILHKDNKNIKASNLYSDYNVRTELLKSKQFNSNTFDTLLNYNILMDVKRGIVDEISNNN